MGRDIVGKIILNTGVKPELLEKIARDLMRKIEDQPSHWNTSHAEDDLDKITWREATIPEALLGEIEKFQEEYKKQRPKPPRHNHFMEGKIRKRKVKIRLLGKRN